MTLVENLIVVYLNVNLWVSSIDNNIGFYAKKLTCLYTIPVIWIIWECRHWNPYNKILEMVVNSSYLNDCRLKWKSHFVEYLDITNCPLWIMGFRSLVSTRHFLFIIQLNLTRPSTKVDIDEICKEPPLAWKTQKNLFLKIIKTKSHDSSILCLCIVGRHEILQNPR